MRSEIRTIEGLKCKIENAPILPKPECRTLEFIYGWKSFVEPWLSNPPLVNHSKYHSFLLTCEEGKVKFRAKRLSQDVVMVPRAGIRLLRDNINYTPVGAADFRVETIPFAKIRKTVSIIASKMSLVEKINLQESWDRLEHSICSFPGKVHLVKKMYLTIQNTKNG